MLKSFFHTGFVVRDLDKSVAFYTDVMGLNLLVRREASGESTEKVTGFPGARVMIAFLSMGNGHNLELIQYIYPPGAEPVVNRNDLGASHLAWYVDDLERFYDEMSQKGLRFISAHPSEIPPGPGGMKAAYALDPDGNSVEFVEVVQ